MHGRDKETISVAGDSATSALALLRLPADCRFTLSTIFCCIKSEKLVLFNTYKLQLRVEILPPYISVFRPKKCVLSPSTTLS